MYLISVVVTVLCLMSSIHPMNNIVVNESHDDDNDGKQDNYPLVEWLKAEGYTVDDRYDQWMTLNADQGIKLTNMDKIAIGLDNKASAASSGGSGTIYVDDIRLYRLEP